MQYKFNNLLDYSNEIILQVDEEEAGVSSVEDIITGDYPMLDEDTPIAETVLCKDQHGRFVIASPDMDGQSLVACYYGDTKAAKPDLTPNIDDDVILLANQLGLKTITAGGGADLVCLPIGKEGAHFTIADAETGLGPVGLNYGEVEVSFYAGAGRGKAKAYVFDSAYEALFALHDNNTRSALIMSADTTIESHCAFSESAEKFKTTHNLTYSDLCEAILFNANCAIAEKQSASLSPSP